MTGQVGSALLLTTGAGLATTIGSFLGLIFKKPGPKFMGFTLGFSAGVMILVSFVELLPVSMKTLNFMQAHAGFLAGVAVYFLIDLLVPHEYVGVREVSSGPGSKSRLLRTGLLVALGVGIHNFPEGMATFTSSLNDPQTGIAIAVAIAIHNIPEGLAVSAPIYAATASRSKAFLWSFLSGVSEPVGAGISALILYPFLNDRVLAWGLAGVAGIMVAISIDELVPVAKSFDTEYTPSLGVFTGFLVMAFSLWMMK
jgi:ZIP family zinc transporter